MVACIYCNEEMNCNEEMKTAARCISINFKLVGDVWIYDPVKYGDEKDDLGGWTLP